MAPHGRALLRALTAGSWGSAFLLLSLVPACYSSTTETRSTQVRWPSESCGGGACLPLGLKSCEEACRAGLDDFSPDTDTLDGCTPPALDERGDVQTTCTITRPAYDQVIGLGKGRPPRGFVPEERGVTLAAFLRQSADLEAASVTAFVALKRDLGALRAPRGLLRACGRAARDEGRHARALGARPRSQRRAVRDASPHAPGVTRLSLAVQNAVEGCVGEGWGALLVGFGASHAVDRELRARFARIAAEEASHAALSLRVHDWLRARLRPEERAVVGRAVRRAVADLEARVGLDLPPREHEAQRAGLLPSQEEQRAWFPTFASAIEARLA
ncbi:MAG: hypothetical protein IPF92_06995 [Myxococcales bacterium]|nr:hypothetical protein [Myxococcales bacterium]MBL0192788.1 hypothetical protein [Myxococcales bacterium]HQY64242.1 hypothetical protein [Polyangiaceae bacterium]